MIDRIILHVANAITLLAGLVSFIVLFFGLARSFDGEPAIADFVLAGALAVIPYCFTGTLHRIVAISKD